MRRRVTFDVTDIRPTGAAQSLQTQWPQGSVFESPDSPLPRLCDPPLDLLAKGGGEALDG